MHRLGTLTVVLHWTVAFAMIGLLALGFYMSTAQAFPLYSLHKSLGVIALAVILARVLWRWAQGWPQPLEGRRRHEVLLSRTVQWVLLLGTLAMPLSGLVMSAASGHGVAVFGLELVPRNPDPANPGRVIPYSLALNSAGATVHAWLGYILVAAIGLHMAGALKHHVFDRNRTLTRMLGHGRQPVGR